jgi:AraC-like DNA-binding protein
LDEQPTTREEIVRSNVPLYTRGGDEEDPADPMNYQPQNIPAVIHNHLRAMQSNDSERMRSFTMRIEETHHTRLVLLAEALGTSKTTLARELLEMATREAIHALPEEIAEDLRRKFLESV